MTELRIVIPDDVNAMATESARAEGFASVDEFLAALVREHHGHHQAHMEVGDLPFFTNIKPPHIDQASWDSRSEAVAREVRARFENPDESTGEVWTREKSHILREQLKAQARERAAARQARASHG